MLPLRRLVACALFVTSAAVPAFAQEQPAPSPNAGDTAASAPATVTAAAAADGEQRPPAITIPALPRVMTGNPLKLSAGDFKHFFSGDTARTLSYVAIFAIASAPWDREGVNNGFNIPTTVFQSGNVIGNFVFQASAAFATYGVGKALRNERAANAGRDIVRAQILSQAMVQTLKFTVRRERPDHSNNMSFPSGHAASAFASATVLHRYYGWKIGAPAYALGSYVALARMSWNKHHATDVVMGAGFGIASARTVTMTMAKTRFSVGVQPQAGGASINFTKIYNK